MKRIALIHNNLNFAGGTETCVFVAIDALNEIGIIPDVFAIQNATPQEMKHNFGKPVEYNFREIPGLKYLRHLKRFEIYKYPLINMMTSKINQYDYVINLVGSCIFVPDRKNYILYIHFPDRGFIEYGEQYRSRLGNLYSLPINLLSRASKLGHETKIICNSQFTKNTLLRFYKIDEARIQIIYPPVKIESALNGSTKMDNEVATIGRFYSGKRQLEQIKIASMAPELKFNIIGSTNYSEDYLDQCKNYIDQHNIKNVSLFPNINRSNLVNVLRKSKYFMHNMRNEHFGISTVDAIAQNCVPIVHNSGGQREIVPFRELRFNNANEAVKILKNLIKNDTSEILIKLKDNIKKYSEEKYREGIIRMIKE